MPLSHEEWEHVMAISENMLISNGVITIGYDGVVDFTPRSARLLYLLIEDGEPPQHALQETIEDLIPDATPHDVQAMMSYVISLMFDTDKEYARSFGHDSFRCNKESIYNHLVKSEEVS